LRTSAAQGTRDVLKVAWPEILVYVIFLVTLVILSLASLLGRDPQAIAIRRTAWLDGPAIPGLPADA
jgi:hypothetical protein